MHFTDCDTPPPSLWSHALHSFHLRTYRLYASPLYSLSRLMILYITWNEIHVCHDSEDTCMCASMSGPIVKASWDCTLRDLLRSVAAKHDGRKYVQETCEEITRANDIRIVRMIRPCHWISDSMDSYLSPSLSR